MKGKVYTLYFGEKSLHEFRQALSEHLNITSMSREEEQRRKQLWQQREELTDEGKELWDSMMDGVEGLVKKDKAKVVKKVITEVRVTEETQRIRLGLKKLQQNSRRVVKECEELQVEYTKKEQYFKANECKIAGLCHRNFIDRIQKILDGKEPFDSSISFCDEEDDNSKVYIR